ncbi:MAG: hypothetical protein LBD15_02010 [Holosporales bacterium]|nr:hypothetical protein [Holosporales bacterium]
MSRTVLLCCWFLSYRAVGDSDGVDGFSSENGQLSAAALIIAVLWTRIW